MTLNGTLIKSTIVAALGGLLFGFDTAVIAGTTAGLTATFALDPFHLGVTVSIALIGTVLEHCWRVYPEIAMGGATVCAAWPCCI